MNDDPEAFVSRLIEKCYGVALAKIPEENRKTPDYEHVVGGERKFVAELKTLTHEQPSEERGWEINQTASGATEAIRDDNSPARVGRVLYSAWKQLRDHTEPKVVILLNEDPFIDVLDLEEAYSGYLTYEGEGVSVVNAVSKRIAAGSLSKTNGKLDLVIFIDRQKADEVFFRFLTEEGLGLAQLYFGAPDIPPPRQNV